MKRGTINTGCIVPSMFGVAAYFVSAHFDRELLGNIYYHAGAFASLLTNTVLDSYSTIKCIREMDRAAALGFEHGTYEANPLLPERPQIKDILSPRRLMLKSSVLVLGSLMPALGYAVAVSGIPVVANNMGVYRMIREKNDDIEMHNPSGKEE